MCRVLTEWVMYSEIEIVHIPLDGIYTKCSNDAGA
jgi:hypothetical protein